MLNAFFVSNKGGSVSSFSSPARAAQTEVVSPKPAASAAVAVSPRPTTA